jgi:hypothetical protein
MPNDSTTFEKENFNSAIKEFENSIQRSQILVSQINHINTLQTKQISKLIYQTEI